jgi:hypothetical protein
VSSISPKTNSRTASSVHFRHPHPARFTFQPIDLPFSSQKYFQAVIHLRRPPLAADAGVGNVRDDAMFFGQVSGSSQEDAIVWPEMVETDAAGTATGIALRNPTSTDLRSFPDFSVPRL